MSATVKLSLKAARELAHVLSVPSLAAHSALRRELENAMAKTQRSSATRKRLKQPKAEKRAAKRDETAAIREAVWQRSLGRCECGCGQLLSEATWQLDHFHGRAKAPQSIANTWALTWTCHRMKTDNRPSAANWLHTFIAHCRRHGYAAEEAQARDDLAWVLAKRGGQ